MYYTAKVRLFGDNQSKSGQKSVVCRNRAFAIVIEEYSPYIWFSLILFILINYYPSFFLLRQHLAIAVVLLSIKYIIKRVSIKFGICALLAFSLHATSVLFVPLYFLYGLKNNKFNMFLVALGSIFTVVLFYSFQDYVNLYSAYYAHYFEAEAETAAWQRALLKIYIAVVYIYVMGKKYYDEGINRIVFYGMVLNIVICIAAMNIFAAHRLREYFAYADFIGVPIMIKQATMTKGFKKPLIILLVAVYVAALVITFINFIQGGNMNNEYQFFWNGQIRWLYYDTRLIFDHFLTDCHRKAVPLPCNT